MLSFLKVQFLPVLVKSKTAKHQTVEKHTKINRILH